MEYAVAKIRKIPERLRFKSIKMELKWVKRNQRLGYRKTSFLTKNS